VLRAVVHNGKQLMMTSLLCCVIVYVYSILGFWAFRDMYVLEASDGIQDHMCDNVFDCFLFTLNQARLDCSHPCMFVTRLFWLLLQGLRAGGGIGDVLEHATSYSASYVNRLIFDLTFFVVVCVILLNVIFGGAAASKLLSSVVLQCYRDVDLGSVRRYHHRHVRGLEVHFPV
jgi:Ion transport protein